MRYLEPNIQLLCVLRYISIKHHMVELSGDVPYQAWNHYGYINIQQLLLNNVSVFLVSPRGEFLSSLFRHMTPPWWPGWELVASRFVLVRVYIYIYIYIYVYVMCFIFLFDRGYIHRNGPRAHVSCIYAEWQHMCVFSALLDWDRS